MAFDFLNLTVSRGNFNCSTGCLKPAYHTYSSDDPIGTITASGYFPNYFGLSSKADIKEGDILQITSKKVDLISLTYVISSVSPVNLVLLDQLEYNNYSAPYSGAASGTLNFSLSRNPSGLISFQLISDLIFTTVSQNIINVSFSFPFEYTPSRSFYEDSQGFIGVIQSVLTVPSPARQFATNIQIAPYASTPIFSLTRMPFAQWRSGWTIITRNFFIQYYGNPLT